MEAKAKAKAGLRFSLVAVALFDLWLWLQEMRKWIIILPGCKPGTRRLTKTFTLGPFSAISNNTPTPQLALAFQVTMSKGTLTLVYASERTPVHGVQYLGCDGDETDWLECESAFGLLPIRLALVRWTCRGVQVMFCG